MWNDVAVIAPVGYSMGVVEDKDGKLVLVIKPVGSEWAHGIMPKGGINTIADGCTRFRIVQD